MSNIYIGVGHGGRDGGTEGHGLKESEVVLDIALACRDYLQAANQTVTISRTDDRYMSLYEKSAQANALPRDAVVEIHCNAANKTAQGFEAFYQSKSEESKKLAAAIEACVKEIGQNSRGIKTSLLSNGQDYYHMVREVKYPATLIECAFLDSEDYLKVSTFAKRQTMGIAIAKGILNYLGKPIPKEPTATPGTPGKKVRYIVQVGAFSSKEQAEIYKRQIEKYGIQAIIKTMEV